MATNIIMPALEMAQETGTLVAWLKHDGDPVEKGEPIMEIETDKVTIEIEAPASGTLGGILVKEGEQVPVGRTIAWILNPGETPPSVASVNLPSGRTNSQKLVPVAPEPVVSGAHFDASPVARKMAAEHGLDLNQVKPEGKRIEKADVLNYLAQNQPAALQPAESVPPRLIPASPKARRLSQERGIDLASLQGSGPGGSVLAGDVPQAKPAVVSANQESMGTVWRVMAERMTASWTSVPHFYLVREVDATNLQEWRKRSAPKIEKTTGIKPTYTDLLVKIVGNVLREHPRVNAAWADGAIRWNEDVNIGVAIATEDGLIVPVIQKVDQQSLGEITSHRSELVELARQHRLRPAHISGGTFTLTNLGMYGVDAFNAIINTPQAAILAVGRIAERVIPVNGQPAVRPGMVLTLSCDHRVVDGARAAQFLDQVAAFIEDPWNLLT